MSLNTKYRDKAGFAARRGGKIMEKKKPNTSTFEVQEQSLPKTEAGPGQKRSSVL